MTKKLTAHETISPILKFLEPLKEDDRKRVLGAVDAYFAADIVGVWSGKWVIDASQKSERTGDK